MLRFLLPGVLVLVLLTFGTPSEVSAQCSCLIPMEQLEAHFKYAAEVFVGKVVASPEKAKSDIKLRDGERLIKVEVTETWKNDLTKHVLVVVDAKSELAENGTEWLIYADRDKEGRLNAAVQCCSRTKRLKKAVREGEFEAFTTLTIKRKKIVDQ